jgi:hypothetical protein
MDSVYENAYLVIAAANAPDEFTGCFENRSETVLKASVLFYEHITMTEEKSRSILGHPKACTSVISLQQPLTRRLRFNFL